MQLNALQTFLAIARRGSFHAAAEELNVTQTAASARIKALERALNAVLFDRGPGGTRLSAAGRQFLPHAEQMLRTWEFAAAGVSGRAEQLPLRLGAQLSVWDTLLVDTAVWLEEERGQLPFTLNYDHAINMAEAVEQRLLDVAIVNEVPRGTRLGVEDLGPEELVLAASSPLVLAPGIELPLFINLEFGAEYEAHLQRVLPERGPQHIVLGNSLMGLRYLLKRGGCGYFPRSMIGDVLDQGLLHLVQKAPPLALTCKALFLADNPALPQIRDVIHGLRQLRGQRG